MFKCTKWIKTIKTNTAFCHFLSTSIQPKKEQLDSTNSPFLLLLFTIKTNQNKISLSSNCKLLSRWSDDALVNPEY